MSMPHLSEVAEKYKNNLTVVGVDIWETSGGHTPTITPERFVKMNGKNMRYNIVTDTKDEWMGNKWMKAAGQGGIPCSFMVKDGIILWIGHPINLDSVIDVVNSGKYDPAAVQAEFKKKAANQAAQEAAFHRVNDPIDSSVKAKDWAGAFVLIDKAKNEMPEFKEYMNFRKFEVILDGIGEDSAISYAKEWQSDPQAQFIASSAGEIIAKKGLKKETYLYAVSLAKKAKDFYGAQGVPPAPYLQMMAKGYAAAGEYQEAVDTQQEALDNAKVAINNEKYKGMISADDIEKMQKELAEYKAHL
jgi:hypothetical protein